MKINFRDHIINREDLLSHLVLHALGHQALEETQKISEDPVYRETGILDIRLSVNGIELDPAGFCDHWQSEVVRMIDEVGEKKVEDKLREIDELIEECRGAIRSKVGLPPEEPWYDR